MRRTIDLSQLINDEYFRDRTVSAPGQVPARVPVHTASKLPDASMPEKESRPVEFMADANRAPEDDWQEKYTRLYAELENRKKRQDRLYASRARQEKEAFLKDMLPVADNLERILGHSDNSIDEHQLLYGLKMTLKAFLDALNKHNVREINALGQPFDPNLHEAAGIAPNQALPPGTVAYVEQKGYTLDGNVLRPARVLVTPETGRG
ncbi:MAG: nucleotide exchange factor GrpE [Anaerolineales bacterium]|nr:nucleotide exchange factor GrpE [Anaerolineales bacterium]